MPFCSRCARELPQNATFCMYCGTPITAPIPIPAAVTPMPTSAKVSHTKRNIAIILLLIIVGGLFLAGQHSPSTTAPPTVTTTSQSYDAVIRYTERYTDNVSYSTPRQGYTYLVITLDITNNVDRDFDTRPSYFTVTIKNVEYDYDGSTYSLDDPLNSVTLHQGGSIAGSIVFEVPIGTSDYRLAYNAIFSDWNIEWIHY